jgi:hypothetical protein
MQNAVYVYTAYGIESYVFGPQDIGIIAALGIGVALRCVCMGNDNGSVQAGPGDLLKEFDGFSLK